MSRSSLIVAAFALAFAARIVFAARARRLHEQHTLLWLAVCGAIFLFALWRDGIDRLAAAMGIFYAPSALFLLASAGMLWLLYRQSLALAELRQQVRQLAQNAALTSVQPPEVFPRSPKPEA